MWVHPRAEKIPRRRKWQPTPIFLPGKSQGQRNLAGYSPWGCKELDTTEWLNNKQTSSEQHSRSEPGIECQGTLFPLGGRVHSFRPPKIRGLFWGSGHRTLEFRSSAQCSQTLGYCAEQSLELAGVPHLLKASMLFWYCLQGICCCRGSQRVGVTARIEWPVSRFAVWLEPCLLYFSLYPCWQLLCRFEPLPAPSRLRSPSLDDSVVASYGCGYGSWTD